ncbi:MgPP2CL-1 [Candida oxycetoniae]|uniref:MgPP2CL-1 n=1 Tax=Candida oxycetoniae TaxID=497107 RepID=A0AAI9WWB9_9ASCO|nr:MgPP2CL-1 [Candida oxycetoniae]KAI3403006.2 MgPP2CL-1 [Candida oxycetoniae]
MSSLETGSLVEPSTAFPKLEESTQKDDTKNGSPKSNTKSPEKETFAETIQTPGKETFVETTQTPVVSTDSDSNLAAENDPFAGLSFKVGVAENKNTTYRSKMEDVHTYIANYAERVDWGYFAIFDGHAGKESARWCGNNLHTLLEQEIDLELQHQNQNQNQNQNQSPSSASDNNSKIPSSASAQSATTHGLSDSPSSTTSTSDIPMNGRFDMKEYLYKTFVRADDLIEKNGQGASGCTAAVAVLRWEGDSDNDCMVDAANGKGSGTTATTATTATTSNTNTTVPNTNTNTTAPNTNTTAPTTSSPSPTSTTNGSKRFDFVPSKNHKRMLYTSNVGDSRIILCRKGKPYRLSYDHKASDINEINRIESSGGLVLKNRVNGVLAVSRSLGDSYMKDLVLGKPFTTSTEIIPQDEFMIIACDGLWDVLSDSKACKYVKECFSRGYSVQNTAKKLCQLAIDNSTTDNVTVMIVQFDKDVFTQEK